MQNVFGVKIVTTGLPGNEAVRTHSLNSVPLPLLYMTAHTFSSLLKCHSCSPARHSSWWQPGLPAHEEWKQSRQQFHKHVPAHLCRFLGPLLCCYGLTLMAANPLTENLLNRVGHSLISNLCPPILSLFLNFIYLWLPWVFTAAQSFPTCSEWGPLSVMELSLLTAVASRCTCSWAPGAVVAACGVSSVV